MSSTKFHTHTKKKRQNILHWMIASIPWLQLLLISSWMECWYIRVVTKYLNCSTLSKDLLSVFTLWFHPTFWSRDMTMYFVLSAFTSSPVPLLATTKTSMFFSKYVCFLPIYEYHLHKPKANVYHLISSHPGLPEPSEWDNLKPSREAMVLKQLLVSSRSY
jgi:hypothetical protein